VLRGGEFYSPIRSRLRVADVLLSELRQPCSRKVPRHEHELAYVTVVLEGNYFEGDHARMDELRPFYATFNPEGTAHSTVIGPDGASFFTIEFHTQGLRDLDLRLPQETILDRGGSGMLWPGLRLYSSFKTSGEPTAIETHALELLGAIAGFKCRENSTPSWFRRVKDRLHEEFPGSLPVHELAHEAGVHPVHLARVFRKLERVTPREYQLRLQVRAACRMLQKRDWPLTEIALECGFSDQSHLTRIFRRITGTTPAQFRRSLANGAAME